MEKGALRKVLWERQCLARKLITKTPTLVRIKHASVDTESQGCALTPKLLKIPLSSPLLHYIALYILLQSYDKPWILIYLPGKQHEILRIEHLHLWDVEYDCCFQTLAFPATLLQKLAVTERKSTCLQEVPTKRTLFTLLLFLLGKFSSTLCRVRPLTHTPLCGSSRTARGWPGIRRSRIVSL